MAKSARLLSMLALFASFFALGVIALGVFTRLIDAGLGCPDWPGCYGHVWVSTISPATHLVAYKAWAEMIHRYFAGCLSLLMISIFIATFCKENRRSSNIFLAFGLLILLAYQIMLGMLTVTLKLLPVVVTQHLLGGFLILCFVWLVYLNNSRSSFSATAVRPWMKIGAGMGTLILFLQISLGAWTSTNYASLSCPDFPFCTNTHPMMTFYFKQAFNIFSPLGINYEGGVLATAIRQTIQMMHRLGALIFTTYILIFSMMVMTKLKEARQVIISFYFILGLLSIQLCLGIANVIFKLPLVTAISHTLVAVLLLLAMMTLTFNFVKGTRS